MNVVVVGGTGYLGGRTVEALKAVQGADVSAASRRGPVSVDVTKPETFSALAGADVIVDLTDGTRTKPDALVAWCLEHGKTIVEATSDADTVRRLFEAHRSSAGPGRLVLGGGIFTGMSNLLAREVTNEVGPGSALTWAVASSPYSGAGRGTIALMVEASARKAVKTVDGRREEVPLERGPSLTIAGTQRPTLRMSLAEAEMLPSSTKAKNVDTYFAPKPGLLVTAFTMLPAWLMQAAWFQQVLELYFVVLRRVFLRNVASSVQMVARAELAGKVAERHLVARDGMQAGSWALAAMVEGLVASPPPPGACFIDDALTAEVIVTRSNALAGQTVFTRS